MARFLSLALLAVLVVGVVTPLEAAPKMTLYEKNLNDVITVVKAKPGYKAFASLVGAILKQSQLKSLVQQNLTIFVPNDKALNEFNLTQYATADLLKVVKYHAVKGTYTFAQLQTLAASGGKLQTTFSQPIALTKAKKGIGMFGMEKIGAAVLDKDISIKPTVVAHGISRVLKPKGADGGGGGNERIGGARASVGEGEKGNGSAGGGDRGGGHAGNAGEAEEGEAGMEYEERCHEFPKGQWDRRAGHLSEEGNGDITTCDYNDASIAANIRHNCLANGVPPLPHIRHTWGEPFPIEQPSWDVIIASDILLYVKEYPNLVKTLRFLLFGALKSHQAVQGKAGVRAGGGEGCLVGEREQAGCSLAGLAVSKAARETGGGTDAGAPKMQAQGKEREGGRGNARQRMQKQQRCREQAAADLALRRPCFVMSWRRRIPREDEEGFFGLCEGAGMSVEDLGSRVFCIAPLANE
ncbi:unnamed protein product [Closterium sp. Yama58-4]|nr:unnamed protein product [Closterium sp. Yama58-4]